MPFLKVSEAVKKIALEQVRLPLSILGDCPQCQSSSYRDGFCTDCGFQSDQYQNFLQAWQEAMGTQQKAQAGGKTGASTSYADLFPEIKTQTVKCPSCKEPSFENESGNPKQLFGSCKNCGHEISKLRIKKPSNSGIDNRWFKKVNRGTNIPSPFQQIAASRQKLREAAKEQQVDLGAFQDDAMNASNDAITRMNSMLQQSAQMSAQNKQQDANADNSEELQ